MPVPTSEDLQKINQFTMTPLTEENCFVFSDLMIDDLATAYNSKLHRNLLTKFVSDAQRGVGLLMNHNSRSLPVGRSYDAEIREEYVDGVKVNTVYGKFYIDLDRNTESNMNTSDIAKGIGAGTIFDTSIGFNATQWNCSICGHDIRDWRNCDHYPGKEYQIRNETNGVVEDRICYVIVGEDGNGELLENSLVYAGACNRATITKNNFSVDNTVTNKEKGTNLSLVDSFKNIPLDAVIYQMYTKDGSVLYTDTAESTNGEQYLKQRSEEQVEFSKFKEVVGNFGISFENEEELSTKLSEMTTELSSLKTKAEEFATVEGQVTELTTKLADAEAKVGELEGELATKESKITELANENAELLTKSELVDTYRKDLSDQAIELGVKSQGNAFNVDLYTRFLSTLSIEEVKEVVKSLQAEVNAKFSGARTTEPKVAEPTQGEGELSAEDFDNEQELRNHVAEKSQALAKEQGISIAEATKLVYKQLKAKNGSEE